MNRIHVPGAIGTLLMWVVLLTGACNSDEESNREPIQIGAALPLTGALAQQGAIRELIVRTAVDEINERGGIDGRLLELTVRDTRTEAEAGAAAVTELIKEVGVVAIVGPASSAVVEAATPIARDNRIPLVAPSSTASRLINIEDDGYMFRPVPNDNVQGLAMAYYLTRKATPSVMNVAIVHVSGLYGEGLADTFSKAFVASGGAISETVTFDQNLDETQAAQVMDSLGAAPPEMIVLIALEGDGQKLVDAWKSDARLASTRFFFADGLRSQGFVDSLPPELDGSLGSSPTFPLAGDAFRHFDAAFERVKDESASNYGFSANYWDAVYLVALGLLQQSVQHPDEELGGARLRDSISSVSRSPGQTKHTGQWHDIVTLVSRGQDVDYDGASGPVDFDDAGETVSPFEIWKVTRTGSDMVIEQHLYLQAEEIRSLF